MFKLLKALLRASAALLVIIAVLAVFDEFTGGGVVDLFDEILFDSSYQVLLAYSTGQPTAYPIDDYAAVRYAIVNAARRHIGARYQWGAKRPQPPARFDCSGLVSQAYLEATGMLIPRTSSQMWAQGRRVDKNSVQPGDIIVFGERGSTTHVAIFVNSTYMIHSASAGPRTGVIQSRQDENFWAQRFMGFVTFVGTPQRESGVSPLQLAVNNFPVEITNSPLSGTEPLPVLAGTGVSFVITNSTGRDGEFGVYFYRANLARETGKTETLTIRNGETGESMIFIGEDPVQYRVAIVNRLDNRTMFDYTYSFEE